MNCMKSKFRQLIPGNPGTSFVVALLYTIEKKYNQYCSNEDQLFLFTKGIVNSRKVFFSGTINEIALYFKKNVIFFSNSKFILNLAKSEINSKIVSIAFSKLDKEALEQLLKAYKFVVFFS